MAAMDKVVKEALAGMRTVTDSLTAPTGAFPLGEEEVEHYGTTQRYKCWQKGPNSLVLLTLAELVNDSCARYADQEFIVYEGKERYTYGQAMLSSMLLARGLAKEFSVQKGDVVAIAGRNYPEWVISFIAVAAHLGAVALPVNSWWKGEELRYGLEDSGASLLIADPERLDLARWLPEMKVGAVCMRGESEMAQWSFDQLVKLGASLPPLPMRPLEQDDTAALMYTSGTTAKPKGVVMTHRNVMSAMNLLRMLFALAPTPAAQHCALLASPLFHVNGEFITEHACNQGQVVG